MNYDALSVVYLSCCVKWLKLLYVSFVWDVIELSWSISNLRAPARADAEKK